LEFVQHAHIRPRHHATSDKAIEEALACQRLAGATRRSFELVLRPRQAEQPVLGFPPNPET
jgi:hypothetical protein